MPARPSSTLFILAVLSIAANVLLAAMVVRFPGQKGIGTTPPNVQDRPGTSLDSGSASTDANPAKAQLPVDPLADFNWAQLASSDRKQYIENLRAFGVPEQKIRQLVIADVRREYRPKLAPYYRAQSTTKSNFWERGQTFGPSTRNLTADQRAELRGLQKEERNEVESLLGRNVYREMARESGAPDWTERMFGGPLPEDKRDLVTEIQERYQETRSEIYAKADGYIDQDTQAELKKVESDLRDELGKVLTPEQLLEYQLRGSDLANNLKSQLSAFEPNEQEYRAIFQYKQAADNGGASDEQTKALEEALGPDRYKEYKLLSDGSFQNLTMGGVDRDTILKVAEAKTQADEAAAAVRGDKSLSFEQRNEALQTLRKNTEDTLSDLLGARRAHAYTYSGGYWVRNLAPIVQRRSPQ